jgi:hypothetical protein
VFCVSCQVRFGEIIFCKAVFFHTVEGAVAQAVETSFETEDELERAGFIDQAAEGKSGELGGGSRGVDQALAGDFGIHRGGYGGEKPPERRLQPGLAAPQKARSRIQIAGDKIASATTRGFI